MSNNTQIQEKYYWLNKDSRKFLESGYLEEGVTPEQRVRQIAENAENILNIKGFADKFENYVSIKNKILINIQMLYLYIQNIIRA